MVHVRQRQGLNPWGGGWQWAESALHFMPSMAATPWNFCLPPNLRKSGLGKGSTCNADGCEGCKGPLCRPPSAQEQLTAHIYVTSVAGWQLSFWEARWSRRVDCSLQAILEGSSTTNTPSPLSETMHPPESPRRLQYLTKAVRTGKEIDKNPMQKLVSGLEQNSICER